ncbi:phosphoenolpyruvate carboxylase [Prosthecobacter sp.]|uniref:phosphoenolpyruvate carboxylase n=1 Tax=Prosthecobacter sp. TaxID=1965333 RepID=UPI003784F7EC
MSETPTQNLRTHGFQLLEDDLRYLMEAFSAVLKQLGEPELATSLPWIGTGVPQKTNRSLGQAYSIAFQMLNVVEERAASQIRRLREKKSGPEAEKGLWADYLKQLRTLGLKESDILAAMRDVCVEPVLTAHPTEAKRETVRELHREIYSLMNRHENAAYTPREQARLQSQLRTQLENLWRTGEIHVTRPSIEAELQNALYYLRDVFPEALARAHTHLREAWQANGYNTAEIDELPPLLRFGSWIGGDRDGHPFVTADVTRHALVALRKNALRVQRRALESLAFHLPLSSLFQITPPLLTELITTLTTQLKAEPCVDLAYILERNKEEPWRAAVYLMRAKVLLAMEKPASPAAYVQPHELRADIDTLAKTLLEVGDKAVVEEQIVPFRRNLNAFGFHSAALDVRQNSAFHEKALDQLLRAAGLLDGGSFIDWSIEKKRALIDRELTSPRPFLAPGISAGHEADTVIACHRVLADHRAQFGNAGLGSLIVSMTRCVEDLLVVFLLAREAGLMQWSEEGLVCPLPVVPLFETMGDLEAGPGIVDAFLSHPVVKRSLKAQTNHGSAPVFQVMVGYSDSNKDCGIVASQCALHRAQRELSDTIHSHGARPIFFHGRGGTVGRGAGPTHWFMEALPHGSLSGGMRMTEQGETIAQKYAHIGSAVYNAELLIASATAATVRHRGSESHAHPELEVLFDKLAADSRDAYRAFLHAPDFIKFYRQATPIDALENSRIGSRPARRTGQASIDDLRAIPWVFSWTQSRFYLPGWFGAGSALNKLKADDPKGFETLATALPESAFLRYVLTNIESSLVSANTDLMRAYAGLVEDTVIRDRFLNMILAEYEATRRIIDELFHGTFAERRPRLAYTLNIREEPLKVLHHQQIALLREWRALVAADKTEAADAMVTDLLISINAIASGLRTTG